MLADLLRSRKVALLQAGYVFAILAAVIPLGADTPAGSAFCTLVAGLLVLGSSSIRTIPSAFLPLITQGLAVAIAIACVVLVQVIPVPVGWAREIWSGPAGLLGTRWGFLSIDPRSSVAALPAMAAPILTFIAGLIIFQSDKGFMRLWRMLAYIGLAFAIFGLAQFSDQPNLVLIFPREHYIGSLTGTFINRNAAAALLGLSALLWLGMLSQSLTKRAEKIEKRRGPRDKDVTWNGVFGCSLALGIIILAMMLTRSRAGSFAGLAALVLSGSFIAKRHAERISGAANLLIRLFPSLLAVLALGIVGGLMLQRFGSPEADVERLCAWSATWRGIMDSPLLGFGAGSFQQGFPQFREPACGDLAWLWNRAHNSYLETWFTLGIAGVAVWLFCSARLLLLFRRGLALRRRFHFAPACGIGAVLLLLLHSAVDFPIQILGVSMFLAAFLAAVSGFCVAGQARVARAEG